MMSLPMAPVSHPHQAAKFGRPHGSQALRIRPVVRRNTLEDPGALDQLEKSLRQASSYEKSSSVPSLDLKERASSPIPINARTKGSREERCQDLFTYSPPFSVRSVAMERGPSSPGVYNEPSLAPSSWQPAVFSDTSSYFLADGSPGSCLSRRMSTDRQGRPSFVPSRRHTDLRSRPLSSDRTAYLCSWRACVMPGGQSQAPTGMVSRADGYSRTASPIFGHTMGPGRSEGFEPDSSRNRALYGEVDGGEEIFAFSDDASLESRPGSVPKAIGKLK